MNNYIKITKNIALIQDLTMQEKIALALFNGLAVNGVCFPSNDYLSTVFNLSTSRCSKIVSALNKKKYIDVKEENPTGTHTDKRNIYVKIPKATGTFINDNFEYFVIPFSDLQLMKMNEAYIYGVIAMLESIDGQAAYLNNNQWSQIMKESRQTRDNIVAKLKEEGFITYYYDEHEKVTYFNVQKKERLHGKKGNEPAKKGNEPAKKGNEPAKKRLTDTNYILTYTNIKDEKENGAKAPEKQKEQKTKDQKPKKHYNTYTKPTAHNNNPGNNKPSTRHAMTIEDLELERLFGEVYCGQDVDE